MNDLKDIKMEIKITYEKTNITCGFVIKLILSEENINLVPLVDKENFCKELDYICKSFVSKHTLDL